MDSFFLLGARGTDNSTCLRQTFPDAIHVDLLGQDAFRTYLASPERLGDVVVAKERLKVNGVLCLPCEEFLRGLTPDSPAPVD